jgi:hypothetical protein
MNKRLVDRVNARPPVFSLNSDGRRGNESIGNAAAIKKRMLEYGLSYREAEKQVGPPQCSERVERGYPLE